MRLRCWRVASGLMLLSLGLMLLSCATSASNSVATPTDLPPITLTLWLAATTTPLLPSIIPMTATPRPPETSTPVIYIVQPGDTLSNIANDFGIDPQALQDNNPDLAEEAPEVGHEITIPVNLPTLTPQPIQFVPPTCYETVSDGLMCLGYVQNKLDIPIGRVTALVELIHADGTRTAAHVTTIEQRVIPPGGYAPYRTLFTPEDGNDYTRLIVSLQSADPATQTPPLMIEDETVSLDAGDYRVTANVRNPGKTVEAGRVIMTVYDEAQHVVGYRIVELGRLLGGESVPVEVSVQPMAASVKLWHTLYAEAWNTNLVLGE